MTLHEAIQAIYPDAVSLRDYVLQDAGFGAYIAQWNYAEPRPTPQQLAALGVTEGRKTMSAEQEWATLNQALLDQAQDIIDATSRPRRLSAANDIPGMIANTPNGEQVGDSGWSKEYATAVNALWESFAVWLQTPLASVNLTPLDVLSLRE